jgi:transposase-like protein
MREHHVYSSTLSSWRKQDEAASRAALSPKRRGPKPDLASRQVQQLTRDNTRLRRELERAELIIDAQKKLCVALGLATSDDRNEKE